MISIFWKVVLLLSIILLAWAVPTWFIQRIKFRKAIRDSREEWLKERPRSRTFNHEDFGDQS